MSGFKFDKVVSDYKSPEADLSHLGLNNLVKRPKKDTNVKQSSDPELEDVTTQVEASESARREALREAEDAKEESTAISQDPVEKEREASSEERTQHGGSGGGNNSGSGVGEIDDPDDGEHTRSTPEEKSENKDEDVNVDDDMIISKEMIAKLNSKRKDGYRISNAPEVNESKPRKTFKGKVKEGTVVPDILGSAHRPEDIPIPDIHSDIPKLVYEPTSFDYEGREDGKASSMKAFPTVLLEAMRKQLRPFGEEFAEKISMQSVVAAFVIANLGVKMEVDSNTAQAIKAYKMLRPNLVAIENRIDELSTAIYGLQGSINVAVGDVGEVKSDVQAVALAQAFELADRVEQIGNVGTDMAATVELDHPKSLQALDNMRIRSKQIAMEQKYQDNRTIIS